MENKRKDKKKRKKYALHYLDNFKYFQLII